MSLLLRRRALFQNGDQRYLYNNGISPVTFAYTFRTYNNPGQFSYEDGYIRLYMAATSTYARRVHCVSQTKVDLTGYSKFCCHYECNYRYGQIRLCLWNELSSSLYDTSYIVESDPVTLTDNSSGVLELPLTDWQGEYYVGIFIHKSGNLGNAQTINIDQIWLE